MASERDLELLDDYISNRLKGDERTSFEQKLQQDPDLRSEYNIQQHIASGLKNARAAELKRMLNNIPVSQIHTGTRVRYAKWAGTLIVALLAGSLLFYITSSEDTSSTPPIAEKTESAPVLKEVEPVTAVNEPETTVIPQTKDDTQLTEKTRKSTTAKAQQPQIKEKSQLDVFDPTTESEPTNESTVPGIDASTEEGSRSTGIIVETDSNNKKYSFHYEFREEKLVLYGAFEKNLYEILEFFTENKRTVFLYYKSNYYLIDLNTRKVNPLIPVNDPALLKKLREQRNSQ